MMSNKSATVATTATLLASLAVYTAVSYWRGRGEKKSIVPSRLKEVSVQIIFSCGLDPPSQETFKFAYTCAMLPYVLGIPSNQVELLMAPAFVGNFSKATNLARDSCNNMGTTESKVLPDGYHEYFNQIYQRSVDVTSLDDFGKPSIRIISGRGFGNREGGYLKFQGETIKFARLAPASLLTVMDISSSSFAVASMTGQMPDSLKNFRTKHKKEMFSKNQLPIVCDYANNVHAFRLGYDGQHFTQPQVTSMDYGKREFARMSAEIGGAVVDSVVFAIGSFCSGRCANDATLDDLFHRQYGRLRREFLVANPNDPPRPYSNLGALQKMLQEDVFPVRMPAFSCTLLDRSDEWFLTAKRVQFDITGDDEEFVSNNIIKFLVNAVMSWYQNDPNGSDKSDLLQDLADREWNTILKHIGPFANLLKSIELDVQNGQLVVSSDGVSIGIWARSYGKNLSACRSKVEEMLARYKGLEEGDESGKGTSDRSDD